MYIETNFFEQCGGKTWQTAITADGINADVGVFGSLHTNNIRIYNGDEVLDSLAR